jgi:DMSO/TMAO reductase YedYZ molybdopterin-dependent catalytic subunit
MMRRRDMIAGGGAALLGPAVAETPALPAGGHEPARSADRPGKTGLLVLSDRPPNYETPSDVFSEVVTPNDRFFVGYHSDPVPAVGFIDDWELPIDGDAAGREVRLKWSDVLDLPQVEVLAVCQSAGNRRGLTVPHVAGVQWGDGAMGCALWHGPRLSDVLGAARVRPDAMEVWCGADTPPEGVPGAVPPFRKSIPIAKALDDDTIVAVAMNGAPLPLLNGYPTRLVVPGWVGAYWVKHLNSITISATPLGNFWMQTADRVPAGLFPVQLPFASQSTESSVPVTEIVVNSIIADPLEGAVKGRLGFSVSGVAWDRGAGIRRVEVSLDDGGSWQAALLGRPLGPYGFRRFSLDTGFLRPGAYRLVSRATSNGGERQAELVTVNPGGYHNNVPRVISVAVI